MTRSFLRMGLLAGLIASFSFPSFAKVNYDLKNTQQAATVNKQIFSNKLLDKNFQQEQVIDLKNQEIEILKSEIKTFLIPLNILLFYLSISNYFFMYYWSKKVFYQL